MEKRGKDIQRIDCFHPSHTSCLASSTSCCSASWCCLSREIASRNSAKGCMYQNMETLWSVLFTTGYLPQRGKETLAQGGSALP